MLIFFIIFFSRLESCILIFDVESVCPENYNQVNIYIYGFFFQNKLMQREII